MCGGKLHNPLSPDRPELIAKIAGKLLNPTGRANSLVPIALIVVACDWIFPDHKCCGLCTSGPRTRFLIVTEAGEVVHAIVDYVSAAGESSRILGRCPVDKCYVTPISQAAYMQIMASVPGQRQGVTDAQGQQLSKPTPTAETGLGILGILSGDGKGFIDAVQQELNQIVETKEATTITCSATTNNKAAAVAVAAIPVKNQMER
jgi:hypothetical protein